ncbi:hypothetical protein OAS39_03745 [Pirellulales bacterium]|nr:hypothetical protein [Pirellulales bacterium]
MDRVVQAISIRTLACAVGLLCLPAVGCLHSLLATGIYVFQGGNVTPAECDALEGQRVVVLCRPPASHNFRHAGGARSIGKLVSSLLEMNVDDIEMVDPREVDNWIDEQDWENFKDLGRSMKANRVVYIELDRFELFKGKTLYQGDAEVKVSVYDMDDRGKLMWEEPIGQLLFPRNSGIPAADKPVQHFQTQFVEIVSTQIAEHFYKHNANSLFALDAVANE